MSKRCKSRLEMLLRSRECRNQKPEFIREHINSTEFYEDVLRIIGQIEDQLYVEPDESHRSLTAIVFEVLPLIETISYNLFNKSSRHYLKKIGYSDRESDVMIRIFRNGYIHNWRPRRLVYDDGEISWSILSGGGNTSPMSYDPGYYNVHFSDLNSPSEVVFDYVEMPDGSYHASLAIDRLLAHIRYDVETRKSSVNNAEKIMVITGEVIKGRRRLATRRLPESGRWR